MKILAEADGGFIVELTTDELACLVGVPSRYDLHERMLALGLPRQSYGSTQARIVGAQVDIADRFRRAVALESCGYNIMKAAGSLESLVAALQSVASSSIIKKMEKPTS